MYLDATTRFWVIPILQMRLNNFRRRLAFNLVAKEPSAFEQDADRSAFKVRVLVDARISGSDYFCAKVADVLIGHRYLTLKIDIGAGLQTSEVVCHVSATVKIGEPATTITWLGRESELWTIGSLDRVDRCADFVDVECFHLPLGRSFSNSIYLSGKRLVPYLDGVITDPVLLLASSLLQAVIVRAKLTSNLSLRIVCTIALALLGHMSHFTLSMQEFSLLNVQRYDFGLRFAR